MCLEVIHRMVDDCAMHNNTMNVREYVISPIILERSNSQPEGSAEEFLKAQVLSINRMFWQVL